MSEVKTNKISSLASNNDITLDPDGTGDVIVTSAETSSTANLTVQNTNASGSGAVLRVKAANTNANSKMVFDDGGTESGFVFDGGANAVQHFVNGSERLRVDSSGNVGIGVSSPGRFVHLEDGSDTTLHLTTSSTGSTGNDGTSLFVDGTAASLWQRENDYLRFATNNTERMRIENGGKVLVGRTSDALANFGMTIDPAGHIEITRDNSHLLTLNRRNGDGSLIIFAQDNATEGNITVAGSTVSLTGGHLARWSRLTSGNRDAALVKGTVMTNLDQMVVWSHAATDDEAEWTEDNEQLNCMAISSVEGDPNVAGVFVSWDEDDDFNDMHVGQTGDMVIRIAQGTTVARGDLLMSAGDGTAKPQDDDVVRSKTIAKVTSTTKSHTYDDGSYLVPCVLMAC